MSRLRKVFGGQRDAFVKTIPKKGYQFIVAANVSFTIHYDITPEIKKDLIETVPLVKTNLKHKVKTTPNKLKETQNEQLLQLSELLKNHRFICGILAILIIFAAVLIANQWSNEYKNVAVSPQSKNKIPIVVMPFTMVDSVQEVNKEYLKALHGQIKTELTLSNRLDLYPQNEAYNLDVSINKRQQVDITVNINHHSRDISYFTKLRFSLDEFENEHRQVINEIAAFTRIILTHKVHEHRLLSAYNPLKYVEIEQLANANIGGVYRFDKLPHYYELVTKLQQKYPQVAEIYGMLARLNAWRIDLANVDVAQEKSHQIKNALHAIRLDPANYDGLHAAIDYSLDFPQRRLQSIGYIQLMKSYYPYHPRVWRSQLKLMIENRLSCDKIQQFVTTIPQGVFKTHRKAALGQILSICLNQQVPKVIYEQLSHLPNEKVDKAIINSADLFGVRDDNLWRQDYRYSDVNNGLSYY